MREKKESSTHVASNASTSVRESLLPSLVLGLWASLSEVVLMGVSDRVIRIYLWKDTM